MAGRELIDELLKKEDVALYKGHLDLLHDMVDVIGAMNDTQPEDSTKQAAKVVRVLYSLLETYYELRPLKAKLQEAFVSIAKTDTAKEILKDQFNKKEQAIEEAARKATAQEVAYVEAIIQKEADETVKSLQDLSKSETTSLFMGSILSKEFADKVKDLSDEYSKAPVQNKVHVLHNHLKSLEEWSAEKLKGSEGSSLSKVGTIISSYSQAFKAYLIGDRETYEKNMKNAKMETGLLMADPFTLASINLITKKDLLNTKILIHAKKVASKVSRDITR